MSKSKIFLASLVLLIAVFIPYDVTSRPTNISSRNTVSHEVQNIISGEWKGPGKNLKKKRRHPLDRKNKMKNGKRCPSF